MCGSMEGMSGITQRTMKMPMSGKMDGEAMEAMDHGQMDHSMDGGKAAPAMEGMDHSKMKPAPTTDHAAMGHSMDSAGRPGSPYESLRAISPTALSAGRPLRSYTFRLQGDLLRYVWKQNGKTVTEADPVKIRKGAVP